MAYKIRHNKTFLKDVLRVTDWLENKWSKEIADEFAKLLYNKIHNLAKTPYAGSPSQKNMQGRKLIITKHNKIYYRE